MHRPSERAPWHIGTPLCDAACSISSAQVRVSALALPSHCGGGGGGPLTRCSKHAARGQGHVWHEHKPIVSSGCERHMLSRPKAQGGGFLCVRREEQGLPRGDGQDKDVSRHHLGQCVGNSHSRRGPSQASAHASVEHLLDGGEQYTYYPVGGLPVERSTVATSLAESDSNMMGRPLVDLSTALRRSLAKGALGENILEVSSHLAGLCDCIPSAARVLWATRLVVPNCNKRGRDVKAPRLHQHRRVGKHGEVGDHRTLAPADVREVRAHTRHDLHTRQIHDAASDDADVGSSPRSEEHHVELSSARALGILTLARQHRHFTRDSQVRWLSKPQELAQLRSERCARKQ